ncbi:UDP-N-acetylmuramoyl-L-alanine--D-glutamate ligase [Reichenbachiella versicolor]|uniref:UDP-N-acetylmuramoyl-L-alanine--D-glutamate ligase n=1 Tax=Reichenbachiella versicolor TaxID=1821036 RepID=UPI000D6E0EFC|nr:UDP-N-acetylmuramoyl-L-alanine--D-glutamate ligase [Reichenbachiella versicolor]
MIEKAYSICVLGSGESGMGAVRLAVKQGLPCLLSDGGAISDTNKNELQSLGVDYEENGHTIEKIELAVEVVKSPGIPNSVEIIREIKILGIQIISEIEFASRYTDAKIVGITGSNGKTTTTLLTTHLLKSAGLDVESAGNVGNSLSNLLLDRDPEYLVLELSSFQLDDIDEFKPDVAAILNITPDHLDRYEYRMELYADAKFNIVQNMTEGETFIFNGDDHNIQARLYRVNALQKSVRLDEFVLEGAYSEYGYAVFNNPHDSQVLSQDDLPLLGKHNIYNQIVAIQIAMEFGVTLDQVLKGLKTFKNAPHRLEVVEEIEGVRFINDSKATNVDAVYYALDAMHSGVVWIAGGVNKGNDYNQIAELVKDKVRVLICLGKDNEHLIKAFKEDVEVLQEVDSAEKAAEEALKLSNSGDTVLLSPACASFDLFNSYEDRGDRFKAAIQELKRIEQSKHAQQ